MIKAVIDIGTNTFNLLIARIIDDRFDVLLSTKEGVAIGMGGINENQIAQDAWERSMNCLTRFKYYCKKWEVVDLKIVATSAVRDAKNGDDFVNAVNRLMGVKTLTVDGKLEAELIYKGVCWSHEFKEKALILDIGGGSTEFILADGKGILEMESFNIGVSRVYQKFEFSDPFTVGDITTIESFFEEKTGDFLSKIDCNILIGASGSFETLFELMYQFAFPKELDAIDLEFDLLMANLEKLIYSTSAERELNQHIIAIRRKMIPIAAVKIRWLIQKLGITKVLVSPCSIKEGVLMD